MPAPAHDLYATFARVVGDPHRREQFSKDPLAVLEEIGFPLDQLDEEKRAQFADYLSSLDLGISPGCVWCRTWVYAALLGVEAAVVLAVIAALIVLLVGLDGPDEEAAVAVVALDEAGVINLGNELANLEVEGFDLAADIFDLPGEAFARACVQAFRAAARVVLDNGLKSFLVIAVVTRFDGVLTDEICKDRGDCS